MVPNPSYPLVPVEYGELPAVARYEGPVRRRDPAPSPRGVPPARPAPQVVVALGISVSEGGGGDRGSIVMRPAPDAGIERRDERGVRRSTILSVSVDGLG